MNTRATWVGVFSVVLFSVIFLGQFAKAGGLQGFPLDDAWIHQVVARTFARTGTLGYAEGAHGAAATSYLWAALLAANYRFVHVNPVVFTFVLNSIAYVVGLVLLVALFRGRASLGRVDLRAWATAIFAGFGANYIWFAYSGMESLLFVALSALAIASFARTSARSAWASARRSASPGHGPTRRPCW